MIPIKSLEEISKMRAGGRILAEIMVKVKKEVAPGKTTEELNRLAESLLFKYGQPSFKDYNGFPASMCTSLNEEVVHGIPSQRVLQEGDVLSLDLGLLYQGFHTDMAVTVAVGKVDSQVSRLIKTAHKAFKRGFKKAEPGKSFGDIGRAIEKYVDSQGFVVIKNLCGHGIGKNLHEEPQVLNFGEKRSGVKIKQGMVFCIEPIISNGSWEIEKAKNSFTYQTKDKSLSVHFEHTVAVTLNGPEILTKI